MSAPHRTGWLPSLMTGAVAAAGAIALMFWARSAFEVRTLPERFLEYVLIFVPLDVFEAGLRTFGTDAKTIALYQAILGMGLILTLAGAVAIRWRWNSLALIGLGLALYLVTMAGLFPLMGAGFFATGAFQDFRLINAAYLGMALTYVALLGLGRFVLSPRVSTYRGTARVPTGRRALLAGAAGAVAAYGAAFVLAALPRGLRSDLPLAAAPAGTPVAGATPTGGTPEPLPRPAGTKELARTAEGVLSGARRAPGQLSPLVTPIADFYVVTKNAGGDPRIAPEGWSLVIDGAVGRPVQLDFRTLLDLPSITQHKTLNCISNLTDNCEEAAFGCDLISNAEWTGVRLRDLLDLAGGVQPGAAAVSAISADEFASTIPIEVALGDVAMIAYRMNGEILPHEHGYPARLLAPDRYGMKSAKWLVQLRVEQQQTPDWYGQRGWNEQGIVQAWSRIDQPANGAVVPPGAVTVAGIAYAGLRGISLVEVSADGGQTWQQADILEPQPGPDAWVRWRTRVDLPPASRFVLTVRNRDGQGNLAIREFSLPQPNGGTGWHEIEIETAGA